ncbi:uncharacterized protein LOC100123781 isoform X1 [Nasonia vitripennis]|uniref:Uncharacterized protein n=1 Tax=Nasonia vitripennis TaxID=7425 RepID=A0A7M7QE74_NASVI|nr:uncharacterized protein LOC100123781 isoform X1 [Nasonia vitripennis]
MPKRKDPDQERIRQLEWENDLLQRELYLAKSKMNETNASDSEESQADLTQDPDIEPPPHKKTKKDLGESPPATSDTTDDTGDKENAGDSEDEEEIAFLGDNPATTKGSEVKLSPGLCQRLKLWMTTGLTEEEKKTLLDSIPRKGNFSFEAPILNEEVIIGMTEIAIKRDAFFVNHQTLAGSALSQVSAVLQAIFNDDTQPVQRDDILEKLSSSVKLLAELIRTLSATRKSFITPGFEKNMRSTLEKAIPEQYLFGNKIQELVIGTEALVKVSKQIKAPPAKKPLQTNNSLNWARASGKKRRDGLHRGTTNNGKPPQSHQLSTSPIRRIDVTTSRSPCSRLQGHRTGHDAKRGGKRYECKTRC